MADRNPLRGLWAAIVLLVVGMTAGFILLSMVYSGPVWVKVVVFVVYIAVVLGVIVSMRHFSDDVKGR